MRKIIPFLFIVSFTHGQNWKWETSDSIEKSKAQLYSIIKQTIAETWKSANDVIQDDDKDGGIVIVKGSHKKVWDGPALSIGGYHYWYNYTVTFKFKDKKYKIILTDVFCTQASYGPKAVYIQKIQPFDGENCNIKTSFSEPGLNCKHAIPMMQELKNELHTLFNSLIRDISIPTEDKDDW